MKFKHILALTLFAAITSFNLIAEDAKPVGTNALTAKAPSHERINTKVLKVFSATHSNAVFKAYLISWKGQEVVVSDTLAMTEYEEGDVIPVLALTLPYPQGKQLPALLNFSIVPPEPGRDKRGRLIVP